MTALIRNLFTNPFKSFSSFGVSKCVAAAQQLPVITTVRDKNYYVDARMIRDVKRRKVVKEYAKLRLQINCIRLNKLLPQELKEIANKEIAALPTDSCTTKLHTRCIVTSRARGKLKAFRMSRIVWRHLADYNQLSGAERAMW